jgi:hypothetical protein
LAVAASKKSEAERERFFLARLHNPKHRAMLRLQRLVAQQIVTRSPLRLISVIWDHLAMSSAQNQHSLVQVHASVVSLSVCDLSGMTVADGTSKPPRRSPILPPVIRDTAVICKDKRVSTISNGFAEMQRRGMSMSSMLICSSPTLV